MLPTASQMATPAPYRPRDYNPAQLALIKRTVAKDTNTDEFDLFVEIAKRVGLDPFRKQIHAIVTSKDKPEKRQLVCVTGIDGYRSIAARCNDYRPDDQEPDFIYRDELKDPAINPLGLEKVTVGAFKMDTKGDWNRITAAAYWEEYAPITEAWEYCEERRKRVPTGRFEITKGKDNWRKMGRIMLAKCAEAQALRKGWPEDTGGIYVQEEMHQAETLDLTPSEAVVQEEKNNRLMLVSGKDMVPMFFNSNHGVEMVPVGQVADKVIAFLKEFTDPTHVQFFTETNKEGLRQFWALAQSDALELKKHIENRIKELSQ